MARQVDRRGGQNFSPSYLLLHLYLTTLALHSAWQNLLPQALALLQSSTLHQLWLHESRKSEILLLFRCDRACSDTVFCHREALLPKTQEPLIYDLGLLAVFDPSALDTTAYQVDREDYLQATAREGLQGLINALWERPTSVTDDGIMASLPEIQTILPREKSLPKEKPLTKWENFAKSKGIASKPRRSRMQLDEDRDAFTASWGYKGKNKEIESQWAVEVPINAPADFDPRAKSKEDRKERVAKNEKQKMANLSRASASDSKKRKSSRK